MRNVAELNMVYALKANVAHRPDISQHCSVGCNPSFGMCTIDMDMAGPQQPSGSFSDYAPVAPPKNFPPRLFRRQQQKTPAQLMGEWQDKWTQWLKHLDWIQQWERWNLWSSLLANTQITQNQRTSQYQELVQKQRDQMQQNQQQYQQQLGDWQKWVESQNRPTQSVDQTSSNGLPQGNIPLGGQCGQRFGICGNGGCCNRNGICATDTDSCEVGCQSAYGECTPGAEQAMPPAFNPNQPSPLQPKQSRCTRPSTRVEFRELSQSQRSAYVEAIKCLQSTPSAFPENLRAVSLYGDLFYTHYSAGGLAHLGAVFLPWHRVFMQNFEDLMRGACGYSGPMVYWDWSLDASDPSNSPVWSSDFMGGNGDPDTGCINSGPFANLRAFHPTNHCVQRRFLQVKDNDMYSYTYTPQAVNDIIIKSQTYNDFRIRLESNPHSGVHFGVGGDMGIATVSASDPIFYLHHMNIDRLWAIWQEQSQNNINDYSGNRHPYSTFAYASRTDHIRMLGLSEDFRVSEVLSTVSGGRFCYRYSNMDILT
ncbi:hypothetical protein BDV3_006766 [Batrachochytrium dendrobatidis]